jgi:hypothetical protein
MNAKKFPMNALAAVNARSSTNPVRWSKTF